MTPSESVKRSVCGPDRKSTRLNSSHLVISYAVFCLKKKRPIRPMMKVFIKGPEEEAGTSLCCATDPALADQAGRYYNDSKAAPPSEVARVDQGRQL